MGNISNLVQIFLENLPEIKTVEELYNYYVSFLTNNNYSDIELEEINKKCGFIYSLL